MRDINYNDLRTRSIFELTDEELSERSRPASEAMKTAKFAKGGYITYFDEDLCPTTSHAVHEYRDRKELMWLDENCKAHFIKTL